MEHDRNQFIVNVFTNGAAPEEKRGIHRNMTRPAESPRGDVSKLRQKLQHDISSKEEGK